MRGSLNKFIVKQPNTCDANVCDQNANASAENVCDVNENACDENVCDVNENASNDIGLDIFDPRIWDMLNSNMKDLLVEKGGPIRENNINFPKDNIGRHFSEEFYVRKLRNGECLDRKWLVYSKELDKVFCFCCKLFKEGRSKSQLASVGLNDWKHLGQRLIGHENSPEHLTSFGIWSELRLRLCKNETLDKDLQDLIKKDTDHWKEVLVRIIVVVKCLAKNNIAFRGRKEKIYEESNGNFLGLIEMIVEFDPVMKQHFERIKEKKNSLSLSKPQNSK